jgi:hypothetical protein
VPEASSSGANGPARAPKQGSGGGRGAAQGQQQHTRRGGRAHSSSSVGLNKQIMSANSTGELLALVRANAAGFDFFNTSTAIARVPKLVGPHACGAQVRAAGASPGTSGAALLRGPDTSPPRLNTASPRPHTRHPRPKPVPPPLENPSAHLPPQMDPTCRVLVDDLAKLMEAQINAFDARGLANAAWALGRLRYAGPSRELPGLIAGAARAKLPEFCAQNIANTLWALVYMHHRSEPLLRAAAAAATAKAGEFKPQELANLVWAYASFEYRDDALLAAVARRAHALAEQVRAWLAAWRARRLDLFCVRIECARVSEGRCARSRCRALCPAAAVPPAPPDIDWN